MSKELFFKMREEDYLNIPKETRERYLSSKRVDAEINDWSENMKDSLFSNYYYHVKDFKRKLEERQYQLREERRKYYTKVINFGGEEIAVTYNSTGIDCILNSNDQDITDTFNNDCWDEITEMII